MTEAAAIGLDAGLSATTRLVNGTRSVLADCGCGQPPEVRVLRGFDGRSRGRARRVRDRLTRADVAAFDAAIPMLALHPHGIGDRHVCAYVTVTESAREADRIAAVTHTPLVALASHADEATSTASTEPVLRATFDDGSERSGLRPFPSASGRVPDVAFDTLQIEPNQPETGELTVRVDFGRRDLEPGTSVLMRCLPETMLVEADDPRGETTTWLTREIEVQQHAGLHRVYRDGLSITDLDPALVVRHEPEGLRRVHA